MQLRNEINLKLKIKNGDYFIFYCFFAFSAFLKQRLKKKSKNKKSFFLFRLVFHFLQFQFFSFIKLE
jgi:hypothetical protein